MTEPTERSDVRPRLGPGSRDPFLAISDDVARIRDAVARAIETILPPGAHLKLTNLVIDNGRVDRAAIVVEVRARPKP